MFVSTLSPNLMTSNEQSNNIMTEENKYKEEDPDKGKINEKN